MAYSFDGLTKADFDTNVGLAPSNFPMPVLSTPFEIRKVRVVADSATAEEILHGGGTARPPDLMLTQLAVTNPGTDATVSAYLGSTKAYVAVDCGAAATFDLFLIWFAQASGGIS